MQFTNKIAVLVYLIVAIISVSAIFAGESVYVIDDTETSELAVYEIDANSLSYQTNYYCQLDTPGNMGAIAVAVDESDYGNFLFVSFEQSDQIELIDAVRMQYEDSVTAPGASDLAGIAIDKGKSKL